MLGEETIKQTEDQRPALDELFDFRIVGMGINVVLTPAGVAELHGDHHRVP